MPEKTPFQINLHHRYDLRDWLLENFPFLKDKSSFNYSTEDFEAVKERAVEIVDACRKIEEIDLRARSAYINYYKEDWEKIRDAYKQGNFEAMAQALNTLVDAINVE